MWGMVVSPSTQAEMLRLGHQPSALHIVPEGLSFRPVAELDLRVKCDTPTFISIGRVIRHKRIHHIIEAFALLKRSCAQAQLQIVGSGPPDYLRSLHDLCGRLGIADAVEFCGFVSEERKLELMRRAHAQVVASIGEGWCLTVTEANAMGTPAITYNVKGLRDSVRHNETGLVTQTNTPLGLAVAMREFLETPGLAGRLTEACWRWSHSFSWESAARQTLDVMMGAVETMESPALTKRPPKMRLGAGPLATEGAIEELSHSTA
jgi:glycosyltransferase involved in cell wall biosynthesis